MTKSKWEENPFGAGGTRNINGWLVLMVHIPFNSKAREDMFNVTVNGKSVGWRKTYEASKALAEAKARDMLVAAVHDLDD